MASDSLQAEEKEGDTSVRDSSPSNRQVASYSDGLDESCEVVDTDRPIDTDALMKARTHNRSMAQAPGETIQKTSKIVTFKLDDSVDQKQQVAATTTTNDEEVTSGREEEQQLL